MKYENKQHQEGILKPMSLWVCVCVCLVYAAVYDGNIQYDTLLLL